MSPPESRTDAIAEAIAKATHAGGHVVITPLLCALTQRPVGSISRIRDSFEARRPRVVDKDGPAKTARQRGALSTLTPEEALPYAKSFADFWSSRKRANAASGPGTINTEEAELQFEPDADPSPSLEDDGKKMEVDSEAYTTRAYKNITVYKRKSDGYFNGTAMCEAFNTSFYKYFNAEKTKAYLDALTSMICTSKTPNGVLDAQKTEFDAVRATLVQVQHGGATRGSWIHERVAIDLARWLSPAES